MTAACPFCDPAPERVCAANDLVLAIRDAFPISPGHTLIVTRRHVASLAEVTDAEARAIWALLGATRAELDRTSKPDGYNVGVNDGAAAGQTVQHLHVHLIPRYAGDRPDPRGGVRWIIPEKANYWSVRGAAEG